VESVAQAPPGASVFRKQSTQASESSGAPPQIALPGLHSVEQAAPGAHAQS
jgi:hypothetical protein